MRLNSRVQNAGPLGLNKAAKIHIKLLKRPDKMRWSLNFKRAILQNQQYIFKDAVNRVNNSKCWLLQIFFGLDSVHC